MDLISSRQLAMLFNLGLQRSIWTRNIRMSSIRTRSIRASRVPAMGATLHLLLLLALLLAARSASSQALSPGGPVDFGSTSVGNTSTDISLTFTANTPTTVSAIAALTDGALHQDFSIVSQSCLGPLSPPASCLVTLNFKPSQLGLRRGELLITDGTGAYANRVPLHGVGLASQVVFSPAVASVTPPAPSLSPATVAPSAALFDGSGNLYVLDVAHDRLLEQTPGQTLTGDFSVAASIPSLSALSSLAIAGDGTLFISSPNAGIVYSIVPGGSPLPLSVGIALQRPAGLATDGYGYLYIADNGSNRLLRVALDGSGTAAFSLASLGTPLSGPAGLAIDVKRNLLIADRGNNRIVRVSLNTGAASVVTLTGLTLAAPQGLGVDSAGTLTVADTGHSRLAVIMSSGAAFALPTTGSALASPVSVLLRPNGDLLVSDTLTGLVSLSRSGAGVTFPTSTRVGTTDTVDGELSFVLQNTGSYDLDPGSNGPAASTGAFSVAGDSTCPLVPATTTSISPFLQSSTCTYRLNFKPTKKDTNAATLTMNFSGVGATGPSGSIAPTTALSGVGYTTLASFALTAAPASTTLGTPVSVTLTALNNDGSIATDYTGTAAVTATDPTATFPGAGPSYTFTSADNGVHTFPAVAGQGWVFNSVGTFTVSAKDSLDSTITGTSNPVQVVNNSAVTLTSSTNPTLAGGATVLVASVAASIGTPTGSITFLDGSTVLGTVTLSTGKASLTIAFNSVGTHTLTASYAGDSGFLPATSAPISQVVEDFSMSVASGSPSTATVVNKGPATYNLVVAPLGGAALAGPVAFALTGLPTGFTGAFTPPSVASGAGSTGVSLLVSGGRAATLQTHASPWTPWPGRTTTALPLTFAVLGLPLCLLRRRRSSPALRLVLLLAVTGGACTALSGCFSDTAAGYYGTLPATQTLTVTATSGQLTHTLVLNLTTE